MSCKRCTHRMDLDEWIDVISVMVCHDGVPVRTKEEDAINMLCDLSMSRHCTGTRPMTIGALFFLDRFTEERRRRTTDVCPCPSMMRTSDDDADCRSRRCIRDSERCLFVCHLESGHQR